MSVLVEILQAFVREPIVTCRLLRRALIAEQAFDRCKRWESPNTTDALLLGSAEASRANPLRAYFEAHNEGRGIWKWHHYFDVYHRHLKKFVGKNVNILEIGIHSGGSLEMWREYFGPGCRVYGVDIEAGCKAYENEFTKIFIGDQADRNFWRHFRQEVPELDIVVDDGSHLAEHQIITLEELLPYLRPGGVYVCEDVLTEVNRFSAYIYGLADHLHTAVRKSENSCICSNFQSAIDSVHLYPFVTVIEKNQPPRLELTVQKSGTQWQPLLEPAKG